MDVKDYKMAIGLSPKTRDFMKSVLDKVSGIEQVDFGALAILEYNYELFVRQSEILKGEDMVIYNQQGNPITNLRVKIIRDAQSQCLSILKEFGLTLKSRAMVKNKNKDNEDSPLEMFIKDKKEVR